MASNRVADFGELSRAAARSEALPIAGGQTIGKLALGAAKKQKKLENRLVVTKMA